MTNLFQIFKNPEISDQEKEKLEDVLLVWTFWEIFFLFGNQDCIGNEFVEWMNFNDPGFPFFQKKKFCSKNFYI